MRGRYKVAPGGARGRRLLSVLITALLLAPGAASGNETVSFTGETISVPGAPLARFDISFVDPATGLYILADRSNARVDVFSVVARQFLFRVGGFAGFHGSNDTAGPNGVLTVKSREIWAGDGNNATDHTLSSVKVIDLLTQEAASSAKHKAMFLVARTYLAVAADPSMITNM